MTATMAVDGAADVMDAGVVGAVAIGRRGDATDWRRKVAQSDPKKLQVHLLDAALARPPRYESDGAAGLDLSAALKAPLTLEPGQHASVPTGLAIALPPGHEGQVRPRSGLAARHGVTVLNAPGTIDEDYRGELRVLLVNLGTTPHVIEPGARIAQLVVAPVTRVEVEMVTSAEALGKTTRGSGGFGSTGA